MAVQAVIFDWGGTLTPWHTIDHDALWLEVCTPHFSAELAAAHAKAIRTAEFELWRQAETAQQSATLEHVFSRAGVTAHDDLLTTYYGLWEPHTYTDPDAAPVMRALRDRGIKIGVLSNTMWPRSAHEQVFRRDGVLSLIDGAVYSSEIPWTKPPPEAFRAAMTAVGVSDPASCKASCSARSRHCHGSRCRCGWSPRCSPGRRRRPAQGAVTAAGSVPYGSWRYRRLSSTGAAR